MQEKVLDEEVAKADHEMVPVQEAIANKGEWDIYYAVDSHLLIQISNYYL